MLAPLIPTVLSSFHPIGSQDHNIGPLSSAGGFSPRHLGVIFDKSSSFDSHVKQVTRSCYVTLRNISKLRTLVSTVVSPRLLPHTPLVTQQVCTSSPAVNTECCCKTPHQVSHYPHPQISSLSLTEPYMVRKLSHPYLSARSGQTV